MNYIETLIKIYKKTGNNRLRKYIETFIAKKEKGFPYSNSLRILYYEVYGIQIGYGTYGGCFNSTNIPAGVIFGNYCSIAQNVKIFRANHPLNSFTSHPILFNPIMGYVTEDKLNRPQLIIGNDVWIGENVVILPNVRAIGNGSIIGAGSIVTKDVESYTIIAGNPAKLIKRRFSDTIIEKLEKTRWWKLEFEELILKIDELNRIICESN